MEKSMTTVMTEIMTSQTFKTFLPFMKDVSVDDLSTAFDEALTKNLHCMDSLVAHDIDELRRAFPAER